MYVQFKNVSLDFSDYKWAESRHFNFQKSFNSSTNENIPNLSEYLYILISSYDFIQSKYELEISIHYELF